MAGDDVVELHTDRATIRPWRMNEAGRLYDIRRRPGIAMWLGDPAPWDDVKRARDHIAECATKATRAIPLSLAVVPDGATTPVGTVSLSALEDPAGVNIGWYLHPDAGGRGWASEAARALMDHALGAGHDLVWAMMWEHNAASAAVCRRIGMVGLGVHVDPWYGTRQYPHSRFFCAGPASDHALELLLEWGRVADLADEPDIMPPPAWTVP